MKTIELVKHKPGYYASPNNQLSGTDDSLFEFSLNQDMMITFKSLCINIVILAS